MNFSKRFAFDFCLLLFDLITFFRLVVLGGEVIASLAGQVSSALAHGLQQRVRQTFLYIRFNGQKNKTQSDGEENGLGQYPGGEAMFLCCWL